MACAGATPWRSTARTRRYIFGTSAGPATACSPSLRCIGRGGRAAERIIIDSAHLKAHCTAASLLQNQGGPWRIRRTKGGLNSKLHAVCDRHARPLVLLLSQGQMSGHKNPGLLTDALSPARELIAKRGHDSDGFRAASKISAPRHASLTQNHKHPVHTTRRSIDSVIRPKNLFAKLRNW